MSENVTILQLKFAVEHEENMAKHMKRLRETDIGRYGADVLLSVSRSR